MALSGRRVAVAAAAVVTGGFLVAAVATEWGKLPHISWRLEPGWLALCVLAFCAFQFTNWAIWHSLLAALGGTLETGRSRAIWNVSLLGRYVPTSALMAIGRVGMAQREGVSRRVTLASVIYELALAFGAAMLVAAYFVVTLPALSGHPARFVALACLPLTLLALSPAVFGRFSRIALTRLGREPLDVVLSLPRVFVYLGAYAVSLLVAGLGVYAFARSLHPLAASELPIAIGSYAVGFGFSLVAFVLPGGLGAREAGITAALSPVLPAAVAVAVAVGVRLLQTVVEVAFAAVTPLLARGKPAPR
jgi:uncharacterized membrane protein YbhN (UPF0104 family)